MYSQMSATDNQSFSMSTVMRCMPPFYSTPGLSSSPVKNLPSPSRRNAIEPHPITTMDRVHRTARPTHRRFGDFALLLGMSHTCLMTDQYYQEDSNATTVLVLGIVAIVVCGILGPFAWVMGNNEIAGIDAGRRDPKNRGTAQAGRILGIIATVLMIVAVVVLLVFVLFLVFVGISETT